MVLKATDRKRLVVFLYSFLRKDRVNGMKKLFISQPMRGKSDEDILTERKKAIESAEKAIGEPVEVIDSFFQEAPRTGLGWRHNRLQAPFGHR